MASTAWEQVTAAARSSRVKVPKLQAIDFQ